MLIYRQLSPEKNIPIMLYLFRNLNILTNEPHFKMFIKFRPFEEMDGWLPSTKSITSCSEHCTPCLRTTNARGSSPALSSGTPITAASAKAGWVTNSASSSAGATYMYRTQLLHRIWIRNTNRLWHQHSRGHSFGKVVAFSLLNS